MALPYPKERHALERDALAKRHNRERQDIEREKRLLRLVENRERQSLERKLGRERTIARRTEIDLQTEFADAARDTRKRKKRSGVESGAVTEHFNESAKAPQNAKKIEGESGESSWKARAKIKETKRARKSKRAQGYAYRRKRTDEHGPKE